MPNTPRTHRFALSICGGVALGAYEAGVVCQLYRDLHNFNSHAEVAGKAAVSVDAISASSAGAVTGLIFAQGIGLDLDPDEMERLLRHCWVDLLDIRDLLAAPTDDAQGRSIFSDRVVSRILRTVLSRPPPTASVPHEPIALWLTMTNLDGVPYVIDFSREGHAQPVDQLYALDYKDYVPFVITGDRIEMVSPRMIPETQAEAGTDQSTHSGDSWDLAAQAARASSAFPVALPPSYQARDLTQYPEYQDYRRAVQSQAGGEEAHEAAQTLPDTARFQFADGGLFSNQPIGRCIDAVAYLNSQWPERDPLSPSSCGRADRSFIVIDAVPQTPQQIEAALASIEANEKDSALPTAILGKIIAAYFGSAVYADVHAAQRINLRVKSVEQALSKLDSLGLPVDKLAELKLEILDAAGLADKFEITLQCIPGPHAGKRRLAGEFSGHFGGFFRADYREADFTTGRHEARGWFSEWLQLWLKDHSVDIGRLPAEITAEFVQSLLGEPPPDPHSQSIPPTELTAEQLGGSNWFPKVDAYGKVPYVDRLSALNTIQRREIVELAEARLLVLLQSWFHVPALLARPESFIVSYFVSPKLIDEPAPE